MHITECLLDAALDCSYKAFLLSQGEEGKLHELVKIEQERRDEHRQKAVAALLARHKLEGAPVSPVLSQLSEGRPLLLDVKLEAHPFSFRFDALERCEGKSQFGSFHFRPVLFEHSDRIRPRQRLLLAFGAFVLSRIQDTTPATGRMVCGTDCKVGTVRFSSLEEKLRSSLDNVQRIVSGDVQPQLRLIRHCDMCKFRERCRTEAIEKDDLSLLKGMTDREIAAQRNKGIFTIEQLSYVFRLRRRPSRLQDRPQPYQPGLHALALREKKTYILDEPDVPSATTSVYVDMEGASEATSIYLIGALAVTDQDAEFVSFWAESGEEERLIFERFFQWLEKFNSPRLFHYGSYESKAFARWTSTTSSHSLVEEAVNLLSLIYRRVYFPVYSNSLKEVGKFLGFKWTDESSSGLSALVWRARWEQSHDDSFKERLIHYKHEDCLALRSVTEFLAASGKPTRMEVAHAKDLIAHDELTRWGRRRFAIDSFQVVADCAYFDYQRSKVFLRTQPNVRKALQRKRRKKAVKNRPNRTIDVKARKCWRCKTTDIRRDTSRLHSKLHLDLKISPGGIRRWITRYRTPFHHCNNCRTPIFPRAYKRKKQYGHSLMVWVVYQQVVNRMSLKQIEATARECFGLHLPYVNVHELKGLAAAFYKTTYNSILKKIVGGSLLHADETMVKLLQEKGCVWVLANMDSAYYLYRPTREGGFLHELLEGFEGVLVSDFYSVYDSLPCPQQKCLVHLMWDINADLLKNPFDDDLKYIAASFGEILRDIIKTLDRYGLKSRYLGRHRKKVARFYRELNKRKLGSDKSEQYRTRLRKYREKLFVFLEHDGIPWNNNNAEHAIKPFAKYRRLFQKSMQSKGLKDYLIMLSIQQTCEYRGVSFFDFLVSGERDIARFCERA